ncbi:MAG: DNA-binding transcriptional regulator Fis [Gammaproteobacteria bacterium]|nr:DNA-binding transcriptional regulator Fis [Gammaproteobacteria bacterium]
MTEAIIENPAVVFATESAEQTTTPLRASVENAVEAYFQQLNGHSTNELYKMVLQEVEEPLLRCVLKYTKGNQSKASEMLGINRGTLRKKLKLYDLHD